MPRNGDTKKSKSPLCNTKRCQVCQYTEKIAGFQKFDGHKYDIRRWIMNCDADFTVYYLIEVLVWKNTYEGV